MCVSKTFLLNKITFIIKIKKKKTLSRKNVHNIHEKITRIS